MEVDYIGTKNVYRALLDTFMNGFIMNEAPFEKDIQTLIIDANNRSRQSNLSSWIEETLCFCSFRTIKSFSLVQKPGLKPYHIIELEPSKGVVTSNWFKYPCRPFFEVPTNGFFNPIEGEPTRSFFIDIQNVQQELEYLKDNIGNQIIDCYHFWTRNDFNKVRWCYRFSKPEYIREAILITQGFVLNYIINHPLDCFNGPFLKGLGQDQWAMENETKQTILLPVLEEYYPMINNRMESIKKELIRHNLFLENQ